MNEEWIDVNDQLPLIGQRVRALVVKELIYEGNCDGKNSTWKYDGKGEHGIYSWSSAVRSNHKEKTISS